MPKPSTITEMIKLKIIKLVIPAILVLTIHLNILTLMIHLLSYLLTI